MTENPVIRYSLENTPITLGYRKSSHVTQTRHFHDAFEILYVIDGMRQVFAGRETYRLGKGDLLFIPPAMLHKSLGISADSEIYSLYLPDIGEFRNLPMECMKVSWNSEPGELIGRLLVEIAKEFRNKSPGYELMITARSSEIGGHLIRSREKSADRGETRISAIAFYIGNHPQEDLSLEKLSRRFFMSESYLSRAFHRETGFTLTEYINHIRVLKARKLLKETGEKIGTISVQCGFGSITHFGRVFKDLTGMAPRVWRMGGKK